MLFELEDVTYSRAGKVGARGRPRPAARRRQLAARASGSGKSTLLRLLNRLADPDSGRVLYEGRDVREHDPLALRREVSLVPQLPALIDGTVHDNVAYRRRGWRAAASTPAAASSSPASTPRSRTGTPPSSRSVSSSG